MKHQRISPVLAPGSLAALGLLIIGGCETPSPTTPFEQARTAFAAGQWAESIVLSTEAINQHPDDVRGYVLRGRAFRRLGQFEPAITDFTIAIQLNPKNPEFYYLRADAYKDRGDIDLADVDDKAGQKLDPSYQRAYLFAPLDGSIDLPPVAEELSRTLRDGDRDATDEESSAGGDSAEGLAKQVRRPRHRLSAHGAASPDPAIDLSPDELFEPGSAEAGSSNQPEIKDIYGLPVAADLNPPTTGLFTPDSIRPGASVAEPRRIRAGQSARPSALRGRGDVNGDRPGIAATDNDPRAAEQGRPQRGSGNVPPGYYPPQRSLHPFGAAAMRSTGVPSEPVDEEFAGDESESGGGRGQGGGGQYGGSQYGPSNAMGGRGYGGPIDPYGGYTRSARPIGAIVGNPYGGGASPYGPGGGQGAGGRRRGSAPRDGDAGPGSGAAPPNPFGPYQPAPVPYIDPAGLRYD